MKHYDWYDKDYGVVIAILCIILGLAIAFGTLCLEGWIFMLLWNAIIVSVFGVPILSFWWAVGILLICRILLKIIVRTNKD